ncbi:MAG: hypothetical protein JW888_06090 [Pirellulales bacterium]|nr:hypothetical protein [Pirellulales bacterium]
MKPPWLTKSSVCCLLFPLGVLFAIGCGPSTRESSPPVTQVEPSDTAVRPVDDPAIEPPPKANPSEPLPESTAAEELPDEGPVKEPAFSPVESGPDKPATVATDVPSPPVTWDPYSPQVEKATDLPEQPAKSDESLEPTEPAEPQAIPSAPTQPVLPLGEDMSRLTPLQPNPTAWVDKKGRRVVMLAAVCQRNAPLEMFACPSGTKEHEAVVVVPSLARDIHAALLVIGAKQGAPVQFHPEYKPASGAEVEIDVRWKDEKGQIRTAKAQEWIRDMNTKKPMRHNWVFGGSSFWTDERNGRRYYQADGGDFICVSNFPSAMLDLPVESSQKEGNLLFEAFTENIPPLGTPVTVILKPKLEKSKEKSE